MVYGYLNIVKKTEIEIHLNRVDKIASYLVFIRKGQDPKYLKEFKLNSNCF